MNDLIKLNLSIYERAEENSVAETGEKPLPCKFSLDKICAVTPLHNLYVDLVNFHADSKNPSTGSETHNLNIASHLLYTSIEADIDGKKKIKFGAKIVAYLSSPYVGLGDCDFQYELLGDVRFDKYIVKSLCNDSRCLVLKDEAEKILKKNGEMMGTPFYLHTTTTE